MNDYDLQQLKLVFADAQGRAAVGGLFDAIEFDAVKSEKNPFHLIERENGLVIAASRVFNESSGSGAAISGKEARAHGVLRSVLVAHRDGGVPALQNLRKTLGC